MVINSKIELVKNIFIVLTTVGKIDNAKKLARKIVKNKVGFCVHIVKIESAVYLWRGKLVEEREYQILIKSRQKFELVEKFIKKNHPYEVPEIVSIKVDKVNRAYLNWADKL